MLFASLLVILTALVYSPGLSGGFILDDYSNIVFNERVHAEALTPASLEKAAMAYEPGNYGRPLATISFAIDYALGGTVARGYKLSSLLVHLANAVLVFGLMLCLLTMPKSEPGRWGRLGAYTIALLWAVHPLQVSSVLYVVQRMETLALTFVLLALLTYLRGRQQQMDGRRGWHWLVGSALLAGIGMLSKETAVLFPLYALALELTILGFEARTIRTQRFLKTGYALGGSVAVLAFVFFVAPPYFVADAFAARDFTLYERLLSQLRIVPMYMGQMLLPLPSNLAFYYDDFVKSTGWLSPVTTLAGGVFIAGLLTGAWWLRRRMPLTCLGILWFFAAHVLTSNVFTLELAFEHRNYFALLGIVLALADLVQRIPMRDGPRLKQVAVSLVVVSFGFLCVLRSATWGDPVHLAVELVAKNPQSSRASNDLSTMYVGMSGSDPESPFYAMGERELERGSRLPGASPLHEQALILMAATTGQPVKDEWWDRLIHKMRTRPIGPQEVLAVTGLMKQRYRGIELSDQRLSDAYAVLIDRAPNAPMFATYGDYALNYLHNAALARSMFIQAVDHSYISDPGYAAKIASALVADGHPEMAAAVLERSRQVNQ